MATHEEQHEAYIIALQQEHAGYVQYGRDERAQAVADELAKLGVKPDGSKARKEPSVKRRILSPPKPETRADDAAEEGG